jgi:osmotically-inducible protein OsmY
MCTAIHSVVPRPISAIPPISRMSKLVRDLLDRSSYYSLRGVTCDQASGQLVLSGTVANYYLKQVAQTIAVSVAGPGGVRNQIRVLAASERPLLGFCSAL